MRLTLLFTALLLSGCVTQRACLEKFPVQEMHDTVIVYRDTVINVPIAGADTVFVYGTVRDTVYASSGTAHAVTYTVRDTVRLLVWQSDTILWVRLDSALQELQIKDREIYTITMGCEKSKTERVLNKIFMVLVAIGFIVLIRLLYKVLT
jgi:hypothetical protein